MTPPVLLLAAFLLAAVVLLVIVLVLALVARRGRRGRAVPPGPRTVAELVELRGSPAVPEPVAPVVPEPDAPGPVVEEPDAVVEPVAPVEPAPVVVETAPVPTAFAADAPWRRGALMAAPRNGAAPGIGVLAVGALGIADTDAEPDRAEPDVAPPVEEPAPRPAPPVMVVPIVDAPVAAEPVAAEPVDTVVTDDRPEPVREPSPTAEQTAADLALLRTFGAADLASRPDRAPDVALTRVAPPAPQPVAGPAQPVRFRVVRRSGDTVEDASVSLLDATGREAATARGATGELTAPGPGGYLLVATAAGHQAGALALCVADEPVETEVLLVRSAALRGTVLGEDGPIAGARITLVQDGEIVEATGAGDDGEFRIDGLAAGEYAVSVAAAGCEPDVGLVTVPDEAEAVHDVELGPAGVTAGWSEGA